MKKCMLILVLLSQITTVFSSEVGEQKGWGAVLQSFVPSRETIAWSCFGVTALAWWRTEQRVTQLEEQVHGRYKWKEVNEPQEDGSTVTARQTLVKPGLVHRMKALETDMQGDGDEYLGVIPTVNAVQQRVYGTEDTNGLVQDQAAIVNALAKTQEIVGRKPEEGLRAAVPQLQRDLRIVALTHDQRLTELEQIASQATRGSCTSSSVLRVVKRPQQFDFNWQRVEQNLAGLQQSGVGRETARLIRELQLAQSVQPLAIQESKHEVGKDHPAKK